MAVKRIRGSEGPRSPPGTRARRCPFRVTAADYHPPMGDPGILSASSAASRGQGLADAAARAAMGAHILRAGALLVGHLDPGGFWDDRTLAG